MEVVLRMRRQACVAIFRAALIAEVVEDVSFMLPELLLAKLLGQLEKNRQAVRLTGRYQLVSGKERCSDGGEQYAQADRERGLIDPTCLLLSCRDGT